MKYLHLTYIFILFSITALGQTWKVYKIDDSVQISLPPQFERKDTLGQTLINAQTSFGNILVTISPDNQKVTPDIEKEKHLKEYYNDFVERINSSAANGSIINENDTTLGKLQVKDVTLATDSGSGKQYRNIRIIHVNSATYTFQFLYQDIHKEYASPESKEFFNSIKIPPDADIQNQFTQPKNTTGESPQNTNNLYWWAGALLLIFALVFFLIRRKR